MSETGGAVTARRNPILVVMVEDDRARVDLVKTWCPPDIRIIHATCAGMALGFFRLDTANVAGVMLDYDLQNMLLAPEDEPMTGADVARKMVEYLPKDLPVLVHSMSRDARQRAVEILRTAEFPVTQIPFKDLTKADFLAWVEDVRERWQYYTDN